MRGGLRTRLILDSARVAIIAALEAQGWFDATTVDDPPGVRRHLPVRYITKPAMWDTEIVANSLAISSDDVDDEDIGLGGELEDTIRCYVDIFAQDDQFGTHFAYDIRDILVGRYASLGRNAPYVDVYDFRQATPSSFTRVEVDRVRVDRAQSTARTWQEHWYMVRFDLIDDFADEFEGATPVTQWADDLSPAWTRIQAVNA